MSRPAAALKLDAAHARLEQEATIELELRSADGLLEPDGRPESGAESLAGILVSARRLPQRLIVLLVLPVSAVGVEHVETIFREHCRARAECAWQRAATIRRAGRTQLLPSVAVAVAAAAIGTAAATVAQNSGSHLLAALLYVLAGVGVISAWVIAWMPIEELLFDWRPDARAAQAYELLADSRLETRHGTLRSRRHGGTTAQLSLKRK
jgi:hypothetical protein